MAKWICRIGLVVFLGVLVINYKGVSMGKDASISKEMIDKLASKKIYFGHQSVGFNIIDGVKEIMLKNPNIKLNIKETRDPRDFDLPVFAHSNIGRNKEPISKIDDFKKVIESGVGNKVDIAFFKFCFVDVDEKTNAKELFKYYTESVSALASEYPKVNFVHSTVPLTTIQTGIKAKIKKLFGKSLWGEEDNIKRAIFNCMIIEKYGNMVFDLAEAESTYPNGTKAQLYKNKSKFEYLISEYSHDGGHLNNVGKQRIAEELVKFLAAK